MTTLTYTDFVNNMGLVDKTMMNVNALWVWPTKAFIGMGNRLHGDGLSTSYKSYISASPNYTTLTTSAWNDVVGWIQFIPAADNTCTNAAVLVWDIQAQWFDLTDNTWKLITTTSYLYRNPFNLNYFITNTYVGDGTADKIYTGRSNFHRACNVKLVADRSASSADTSKYRFVHNGIVRASLDYTKIGGIAVMCKAKMEPISGSLNGVPSIYFNVGADYYPQVGINANDGLLTGYYNVPAVGAGQLRQLTTTEQTFLFVSAKINNSTDIDLTNKYVTDRPAGTYPHVMTDAVFAANVPQFIKFNNQTV